jgi:cytochrome c biogenesis factor
MTCYYKNQEQPYVSYTYLNLVKDFRLLMTQLAYLTRSYFASVYSGFGNAQSIADHLNELPIRFKEKAELIFGTPLSEEFMNLLSIYVVYIQSLAQALYSNDQAAADSSVRKLYQTTDELAAQYAKMNPFWSEQQWKTLLYNFINLVIQDAVALRSRDYDKDMDIYDRMLLAALAMGDYQADGLYQYITAAGRQPE